MIPLRLRLQNFMCYRDPEPLDFSGIHLACLAGDNGHGKSALLDAMTWALWGKARDGKRSADELIRLGETNMEVEFEFSLDEQRYRVIRKRSSRGRGNTILELQLFDGRRFQPLTESGIRDTQVRIDRLLRMDYDTFINSAFLLQGRADEFTVKTAGERKQILGEILGLSLYDEFEREARQRATAKEREAEQLDAQIREMESELTRREEYEMELGQADQDAAQASQARQEAEEEVKQLSEHCRDLQSKAQQVTELTARLRQAEAELAALSEHIAEAAARITTYEALLAQASVVRAGYANLQAARARREELDQKLGLLMGLSEQQRGLETAIAQAEGTIVVQQQIAQQRIAELAVRAEKVTALQAEREALEARLLASAETEAARLLAQEELQELTAATAALQTLNAQLKTEMEPLREKIALLESTEAAACPLCGQTLPDPERAELIAKFSGEGRTKGDQYRANLAELHLQEQTRSQLVQTMAEMDRELQQQSLLQRKEAALSQQLVEAQSAAQAQAAQQELLITVERKLADRDYALQEQAQLADVQARIRALDYDASAHEDVRAQVTQLGEFEPRSQQLVTAEERLQEERASVQRLRQSHARWQNMVGADEERRSALASEVVALPGLASRLQELEPRVDRLSVEERLARDRLAAARQKLMHCDQLAKRREEWLTRQQATRETQAVFEELQTAFGKQGIQAMLIESAIPEIEGEANDLLTRMTNGRMHVRFETQREKKSDRGEFIETLDISISDEAGPRDYNLYSGGEAFRINFAIRIALSKLLARRAGTRLQTLVIDEGFGTQDAEGRIRLVEAINAIKDDFARVLVITHIEELKDAFPVRIDVQKTPRGSLITVR